MTICDVFSQETLFSFNRSLIDTDSITQYLVTALFDSPRPEETRVDTKAMLLKRQNVYCVL